jgi:hypothetical protein
MYHLPYGFGAAPLRKRRARPALMGHPKGVSTGDPVQDLQRIAAENGYAGDPGDLQEMADYVWQLVPTDDVGELLEELASRGFIQTPF